MTIKDVCNILLALFALYACLKIIDIGVNICIDKIMRWTGLYKNTSIEFPVPKEGESIVINLTTEKNKK